MPFPEHGFTIHGGCSCNAIRYKVEVPDLSNRTIHPTPSETKITYPFSAVCHCNDCRRATGALLTYAYCCAMSYVSFSLAPRTRLSIASPSTGDWIEASELYPPGDYDRRMNYLQFYASSAGRTRSFCGRCGTTIGYSVHPMPEGFSPILDLWTGSVDREDLEKDWLVPEMHVHLDVEIPWVGKLAVEGSDGLGKPPKYGRGTGSGLGAAQK